MSNQIITAGFGGPSLKTMTLSSAFNVDLGEIHTSDIHTFVLPLRHNNNEVLISGSQTFQMLFCDPDGITFSRVAAMEGDGTDGRICYTTTTSDLDKVGEWSVQAKVDNDSSSIFDFNVFPNL